MLQVNKIYHGDCREVLGQVADGFVQCVVSSPPYWGLRDYSLDYTLWGGEGNCPHDWVESGGIRKGGKNRIENPPNVRGNQHIQGTGVREGFTTYFCFKCGSWLGTLGLEPTPELYVEHIVEVFRELRRVLRDDGTVWLNLGSSYWGGKGKSGYELPHEAEARSQRDKTLQHGYQVPGYMGMRPADGKHPIFKPKDLVPIPWMVGIALQADGWWLRSSIIWHKPDPMPESVTDRPTRDYDYVFLLAKSKKYYYDAEAIREPNSVGAIKRFGKNPQRSKAVKYSGTEGTMLAGVHDKMPKWLPGGRNKRTVWTIPTGNYPGAHFATFPEKLVEPCILAGSAVGDIVLDPFAGSGTTCAVAKRLGRSWIGIEANPEYVKLAEKRVREAVYEPLLPGF